MNANCNVMFSPWRLWDDLVSDLTPPGGRLGGSSWWRGARYPRVNGWEGPDGLVVEAELPGIDPRQVEVSVEGSELALKGTVGSAGAERSFERRFELPFAIDAAQVQANYARGILQVTLPKAASAQRRTVAITTE